MSALGSVGEGLVELAIGPQEDDVRLGYGGDAGNVAVMGALLGAPARIGGRVGDDALGRRLTRFWGDRGVDLGTILVDGDAPTGLYVNEQLGDGEHRFSYFRRGSAGSRLGPADLGAAFFDTLEILVVTGVTLAVSASSAAAVEYSVSRARAIGARVACVLNHRPALGGDLAVLMAIARASDIVIASREDTLAIAGVGDPEAVANALEGAPAEIVLTDGSRPATVATRDGTWTVPVPAAQVASASGAGDALAGAYLASRLIGRDPETSLAWGVAASSISVERPGCAGAYPSLEETRTRLASLP